VFIIFRSIMNSDTAQWIVIGVIVLIVAVFVLPHLSEVWLGPRMDTTIKADFDSTGNLTKYDLNIKMTDYGYSKLQEVSISSGKSSIKDFLLRNVSNKDDFSYYEITNKTENEKSVRLFAVRDFDPNSNIPTIHIIKNDTYWIYKDESFKKSYFLPDNFVNKITYTLTAPTHSVEISPAYNDTGFIEGLLGKTKVTWELDRNRDTIPFTGNAQPIPEYSVIVYTPKTPGFGIILCSISILLAFFIHYRKRNKKLNSFI
jgi:hypothetical protein